MTPGKSTSTILWMPGPLTLKDIVWHPKKTNIIIRGNIIEVNQRSEQKHCVQPHSWRSGLPSHSSSSSAQSHASGQLAAGQRRRCQTKWCKQVKKRLMLKFILGEMTLWLTSSSFVRSNSRPLSLNMATWWGPSLSVTCRKIRYRNPDTHFSLPKYILIPKQLIRSGNGCKCCCFMASSVHV